MKDSSKLDRMEPTPCSVLMSRARTGAGESQLDVPEDWLQGRTLFGGLQAAVAFAAMRSLVPQAPLRSLQATFLAPVPGGRGALAGAAAA